MDRTTKVVWPDLAEWVEWAPVLKQFRVNPRAAKPDIQALTRLLLRNDEPLPSAVRLALAGLLGGLAGVPDAPRDNWRLRPHYIGQPAAALHEARKERLLEEALKATPKITAAAVKIDGDGRMSDRTAFKAWKKLKAKRARTQAVQKGFPELRPELVKELLNCVRLPPPGGPIDEATLLAEMRRECRKFIGEFISEFERERERRERLP